MFAPINLFGFEFPWWSLLAVSFLVSIVFGFKGSLLMFALIMVYWCYRQGGTSSMFNMNRSGPLLPTTNPNPNPNPNPGHSSSGGGIRTLRDFPSNQPPGQQ